MLRTYLLRPIRVAVAVFTTFSALAAPLDSSKLAADAKWILHLDMDAFRKTTLGKHVIEDILQPKLDSQKSLQKLDLSINAKNISSITAYGPEFEKNGQGVLMIETSADVKADLDKLAGMAALSGNSGKGVELVNAAPYSLYKAAGDIFIAPKVEGKILVAKSKEQIARARDVLLGKSDSLAKTGMLKSFPTGPKKPFFFVAANGFSDQLPSSPQAQMLREANGGRIMLSEHDGDLLLNVVLRSKDETGAGKIQAVLQGIAALLTLSQEEKDQDVVSFAKAAKIASEGQNVVVDVHFPASKAIHWIEEKHVKVDFTKKEGEPGHEVKVDVNVVGGEAGKPADDSNK